ncbi:hypothetical protein LINGRAHAP2_LOCUS17167 [Linum grandiflorum]
MVSSKTSSSKSSLNAKTILGSLGGMSKVGLDLQNFINPELTWKTVAKGCRSSSRRPRRHSFRNFVVGEKLSVQGSRKVEEGTASDTEKHGVAILGRRFSDKIGAIPLKKRRVMLRTPSPPPRSRQEASKLVSYSEKLTKTGDDSVKVDTQQKSEDFSRLEILAAVVTSQIDNGHLRDIIGSSPQHNACEGEGKGSSLLDETEVVLPKYHIENKIGSGSLKETGLLLDLNVPADAWDNSSHSCAIGSHVNASTCLLSGTEETVEVLNNSESYSGCKKSRSSIVDIVSEDSNEPLSGVSADTKESLPGVHKASKGVIKPLSSDDGTPAKALATRDGSDDSYGSDVYQTEKVYMNSTERDEKLLDGGYDSQFEDGELRETDAHYYWDENGGEEDGEVEQVDYGSQCNVKEEVEAERKTELSNGELGTARDDSSSTKSGEKVLPSGFVGIRQPREATWRNSSENCRNLFRRDEADIRPKRYFGRDRYCARGRSPGHRNLVRGYSPNRARPKGVVEGRRYMMSSDRMDSQTQQFVGFENRVGRQFVNSREHIMRRRPPGFFRGFRNSFPEDATDHYSSHHSRLSKRDRSISPLPRRRPRYSRPTIQSPPNYFREQRDFGGGIPFHKRFTARYEEDHVRFTSPPDHDRFTSPPDRDRFTSPPARRQFPPGHMRSFDDRSGGCGLVDFRGRKSPVRRMYHRQQPGYKRFGSIRGNSNEFRPVMLHPGDRFAGRRRFEMSRNDNAARRLSDASKLDDVDTAAADAATAAVASTA